MTINPNAKTLDRLFSVSASSKRRGKKNVEESNSASLQRGCGAQLLFIKPHSRSFPPASLRCTCRIPARRFPSHFSFPFIRLCAEFLHSAFSLPSSLFWPRAELLISLEKAQYFAALLAAACVCGACESLRCGPTGRRAARSCGRNPTEAPGAREGPAGLAEVERSEP